MADAQDLKSWASKMACGFESRLRHQSSISLLSAMIYENSTGLEIAEIMCKICASLVNAH